MKVGETKTVLGYKIKAVAGNYGCYNCDLKVRDREHELTLSQQRKLSALCGQMPRGCVDELIVYKIVGELV